MKTLMMTVLLGGSALMAAAGTSVAYSENAISLGSGGMSTFSPTCATFDSHGFMTVISNAGNINSHRMGMCVLIR